MREAAFAAVIAAAGLAQRYGIQMISIDELYINAITSSMKEINAKLLILLSKR